VCWQGCSVWVAEKFAGLKPALLIYDTTMNLRAGYIVKFHKVKALGQKFVLAESGLLFFNPLKDDRGDIQACLSLWIAIIYSTSAGPVRWPWLAPVFCATFTLLLRPACLTFTASMSYFYG
jgi:hypothetical protein